MSEDIYATKHMHTSYRLGAILMLTPYTYYIKNNEINYVYRTIYTHRMYIIMRKCIVMSEYFGLRSHSTNYGIK